MSPVGTLGTGAAFGWALGAVCPAPCCAQAAVGPRAVAKAAARISRFIIAVLRKPLSSRLLNYTGRLSKHSATAGLHARRESHGIAGLEKGRAGRAVLKSSGTPPDALQ